MGWRGEESSELVALLSQRLGQARAQIVCCLAAAIATYLRDLLGDGVRILQQLLPRRRAIERLDLAKLVGIVVLLDLRPVLCQRLLDAEQNDRQQRLVLIG